MQFNILLPMNFSSRRSRVAQTAAIALSPLLLTGCVYAPETVRIVNASGERFATVEVSVSGRSWHLSNIGVGEVRELNYRAGWFAPAYDVHVEYEMGGAYSFAQDDSTLDSATFIIGKQAYHIYYSKETMPRYENWLLALEASRASLSERRQRVTGLSDGETTLRTFRKGAAIQMLEMEYGGATAVTTETFYLGPDERLLAIARREKRQNAPLKRVETYYFDFDGAMVFYTAASPPQNPEDTVQINAAYERQYFERFLEAAERSDEIVQIDWINRE